MNKFQPKLFCGLLKPAQFSCKPNNLNRRSISLFKKHSPTCPCCFLNNNKNVAGAGKESFSTFESFASDEANIHIKNLLDNNKAWIEDKVATDPEFLTSLKSPQKPKYLYFGCSDSRVPANEIFGLGPGQLFVHRNIGNLVLGNDLNALSVLEYAVGHLDVQDILVTGHYNCGAIRAATARQDLGTLENWLRMIRDVYRLHKEYLDLIYDPDRKHCALVELNVIEQCLNIFKTGIVQRKRLQVRDELMQQGMSKEEAAKNAYPRIHGLVFDTNSGYLKSLPVDFSRRVGSLDHIYGLYSTRLPDEKK